MIDFLNKSSIALFPGMNGSIVYPDVYDKPKKIRPNPSHNFPKGQMGRLSNLTGEQLLEILLRLEPMQNFGINSNTVVDGEPVFASVEQNKPWTLMEIPEERVMPGVHFNSCAVVASSGGLIGSGLGAFIGEGWCTLGDLCIQKLKE
jgi:hypothetical protein